MRGDIRTRLARALERGQVRSAGKGVSEEVRRKLDRALAGTGMVDTGEGPLPRVYSSSRLLADPAASVATLPGEELSTPVGPVMRRRWRVPLEELASVEDLDEAREGAGVLSVLLDAPAIKELDPRRCLYLDTETTGLSGGTGTYVFLLGLGWVEGEDFVVEQLFLRDFNEEPALLHRASELADRYDTLVSFNGRRYDLPLLDTRLVLNRFDGDLRERPQLDLLQPARLLYSGRFDDCRLQTLERELLGQVRDGDVPGAEIPALYFDYLAGGDARNLLGVFEHNFLDVVTLLALTAHFLHLSQRPALDPRAMGGLGRLHERRGDRVQARELLEEARRRQAATYRDLRELGMLYKRQGDHEKALEIWKTLIGRQKKYTAQIGFDVTPFEEAAKYYEHRARDYRRAMRVVAEALEQTARHANGSAERLTRLLNHRADRLRRHLGPDVARN